MPFLDRLPETLHSDRLLIRVARPGDGAMFSAAIADSHADLAPWLAWVTPPHALTSAPARISVRTNSSPVSDAHSFATQ